MFVVCAASEKKIMSSNSFEFIHFNLMDEIEIETKKILPSLDEETVISLIQCLVELGVREKAHLELVEEKDLTGVLNTIQARLLIRSWKKKDKVTCSVVCNADNEVIIKKEVVHDTHKPKAVKSNLDWAYSPEIAWNNEATTSPVCNEDNEVSIKKEVVPDTHKPKSVKSNLDWAYSFEIAWNNMPKDIIKSLKENKRPSPSLRRKLVRIVSDDIYMVCEKPGRKALAIIARKMVKEYSASLADYLCGEIVGEGHSSLLKQLEVRFHNLNRASPYNIMKRTLEQENSDHKKKKLKVSDCYGCVNWQPSHLPIHETEETQQSKKATLLEMSSNKSNLNMLHVKQLLEDTYYTLRKDINSKNSIIYLKKEWPLLFTKEGIFQHFNMLMDIDIMQKITDTLFRKGIKILKFLKTLPCKKKQEEKMQQFLSSLSSTHEEDPDLSTLIILLTIYFDEDVNKLFITGVETVTADETESMDLPNTPCLICYGEDVTSASSYMLCIDGKVVLENINNFLEGFALMFSSYYCFNINYPKAAATTLEFVQRCFVGINPNRGSKVDTEKKGEYINSKILNILKGFSEFKLDF